MFFFSGVTISIRNVGSPCEFDDVVFFSLLLSKRNKNIFIFLRAKCGNGFDDATLEKLQTDLKSNMEKISKNPNRIPSWLQINRELIPDFLVVDPKKSPVWEITVIRLIVFLPPPSAISFSRAQNFQDRNNTRRTAFQFDFLVSRKFDKIKRGAKQRVSNI